MRLLIYTENKEIVLYLKYSIYSDNGKFILAVDWFCSSNAWWRHQMETFFRATGHLGGEFTGLRWILRTKANDAELLCFLWSAPE